jgi:hypothetical protein
MSPLICGMGSKALRMLSLVAIIAVAMSFQGEAIAASNDCSDRFMGCIDEPKGPCEPDAPCETIGGCTGTVECILCMDGREGEICRLGVG